MTCRNKIYLSWRAASAHALFAPLQVPSAVHFLQHVTELFCLCWVFLEIRHLSLNCAILTHLYQLMYSKSQRTSALWCCKRSFLTNYLQMHWFLFLFFASFGFSPTMSEQKTHKTENLFCTNLVRFLNPFAAMLEQRGTERVNVSSCLIDLNKTYNSE